MFCGDKILISNFQAIQILKRTRRIPQWFDDYATLPPDPEGKIIFVQAKRKFMVRSPRRVFKPTLLEEFKMKYDEMVEAVREGKRATRPTWKEGEFVFSNGKVLIHTTPYWSNEKINQDLGGYPYVCEHVDVVATDWALCG